jgi:asparagine synthase (glutamine-hydrolysing)
MYDYLLHGLLHHKQASIYEDVKMVASSSYSILGEGGDSISCAPYYVLELEERETDAKDLKALFQKSVERHLIADVEVASSLSGGIDSSAFACIASRFNTRIKTFSYVPTEKEFSEKDFIEEVLTSNNLGNNSISPDFEAHIAAHEEAIMANDAPALTMSLMSHYLLYANVASQNIKVLLSGQGADELLAGYGTYYLPFLRSLKKKNKAKWLVEMFSLVINYPGAIKKFISRSMDTTDYTSFVKNGIMGRTLPPGNFEEYYKYMIEYGLLPALLQFEDRNAMAHGVEGRLPFLDRDFSRSCHGISPELKIKKGIRKYIFRKAMEGIVPQKILSRKDKMGYVSPQEKWMEENQEYFTGKITEGLKKHEGWVDETVVDFICQSFKDKNRKHYPFIWRLFSFYQFLEKH